MPILYKNKAGQVMFTMVDKTDFASIESGISKSALSANATFRTWLGYHDATSGVSLITPSNAVSLVRSGIFKQVFNAAELSTFDYGWLQVQYTTSCADQNVPFDIIMDPSDIHSLISDVDSQVLLNASVISDVDSQLLLNASMISDAMSAAQQANSRVLVIQSLISDVDSQVLLNASMISDAMSAAQQANSRTLVNQSLISDVDSQLLLNASMISDIQSAIDAGVILTSAALSDIVSAIWSTDKSDYNTASMMGSLLNAAGGGADAATIATKVWSDFESKVGSNVSDMYSQLAAAAGITASDVLSHFIAQSAFSDIASQVWAHAIGSDINSKMGELTSRITKPVASQSLLSDVHSDLRSYMVGLSGLLSDVESQIDAGVILTSAALSDIVSAIWSTDKSDFNTASMMGSLLNAAGGGASPETIATKVWSDFESKVGSTVSDMYSQMAAAAGITASDVLSHFVAQSAFSDIASQVWAHAIGSDINSKVGELASRITKPVASESLLSDVDSQLLLNASMISDALSAAQQANSRVLVNQSLLSDIDSQLLLNASMISDIDSQIDAGVDAVKISGSSDAADNLEVSAETMVVDTVDTGYAETTTTFKGGGTATLSAVNDHYKGRIVIFTDGTLAKQATDITGYNGTTKVFTVTALTSAPTDGDGFVIV